ncbi:MAG: M23 family metallopeptidase [Peptococcaceae bacterium]|nr:M23 family metallopeptidase [Peptococcaceae bacterium]
MKNHAVKILATVIGLAVILAAAGVFFWNQWNPSPVSATVRSPWVLTEENEPRVAEIEAGAEIKTLHKALSASRQPVDVRPQGLRFDITFYARNDTSLVQQLWVDAENQKAYLQENRLFYEISAQDTDFILRLDAFSDAYLDVISPLVLQISAWDETVSCLPGDINMRVATLDNTVVKTEQASPVPPEVRTQNWDSLEAGLPPLADEVKLVCFNSQGESIKPQRTGTYSASAVVSYSRKTDGQLIGTVTYPFTLTLVPEPEGFLAEPVLSQGDLGCIAVKNLRPIEEYQYRVSVPYLERELPLEAAPNGIGATLFEVPNATPEGVYDIEVFAQKTGADDPEAQYPWESILSLALTVEIKEFVRQDLTPTTEMSSLYTNANLRSDQEKVAAARALGEKTALWHGPFIMPVSARISTQYGEMRYVDDRFSSQHNALDIAAPMDTPVMAAAAGRVVLADDLIVSGKAVYIDHGAGLFSSYIHLNEYTVEVGQTVSQGEIIGYVGSTGYSTGAHLHFGVTLGSVPVDPNYLLTIDPLTAATIQCW